MAKLDEKDCIILNMLQENCRVSLTDMAKRVGLSVDSVKKRVKKMENSKIFYPRVQIRPRHLGFENIVDVKIKLHNYTSDELSAFVKFLKDNQQVPEVFLVSGEWDLSLVIMAKNSEDLGELTASIRKRFGNIIREWSESLTTIAHKFETYDMLELMGHRSGKE
ncbi:MAG: Lrp/AsnC family transcriptional regulator [archaeon]|jgi:DNA-binding Lrp family transcriptional regulator|nr:Lrp/AsnC family transcriptional regulator [archaeon]